MSFRASYNRILRKQSMLENTSTADVTCITKWRWFRFLDDFLRPCVVLRKFPAHNGRVSVMICQDTGGGILLLFVGCFTSHRHASVSQGRICSDNCTCRHSEIEVADQTFHLTQSQYTDTGPTSPSADSITPGAWKGSHWSANFEVTGMTRPKKNPGTSGIRTRNLPLSRWTP